jgi:hypothetical protein
VLLPVQPERFQPFLLALLPAELPEAVQPPFQLKWVQHVRLLLHFVVDHAHDEE